MIKEQIKCATKKQKKNIHLVDSTTINSDFTRQLSNKIQTVNV